MKQVIVALGFLSSLVALVVLAGGGLALLAIENSGERGTGALLAFCGAIAFASVMVLLFAKEGSFQEPSRRAGAVAAAIIGAMPVAGLSVAAFRFAGVPIASTMPLLDWTIFAIGVALGLGAISIMALGYRRAQEVGAAPNVVVHMQQIRHAQQQLRSALEASRDDPETDDEDGDVRVRRV